MTRPSLIEAMARVICHHTGCSEGAEGDFKACDPQHCACRRAADKSLTALADQGYAVVPKAYPRDSRFELSMLQYTVGNSHVHVRMWPAKNADLAMAAEKSNV